MVLYISTVLVKVYFGYIDGVARPTVSSGPPLYGQLLTERVRGMQRLELWPVDFAMNTKATTTVEPHCLWKPEVSAILDDAFAFSGLERTGRRWVAQRWMCQPCAPADIQRDLREEKLRRPREIPSNVRP
jgi:hypothetical protein